MAGARQCNSLSIGSATCNPTFSSLRRTHRSWPPFVESSIRCRSALELAAPWIKVLTLDGLLKKLERDVLLSSTSARDLPERQQTMNATVAWSYQLLDEAGRRAFRRFGALPGLFPIDAAAEVLAGRERASDESLDAFEAVASLMDKSLLSRS